MQWLVLNAICAENKRQHLQCLPDPARAAAVLKLQNLDLLLRDDDREGCTWSSAYEREVNYIVDQWRPRDPKVKDAIRERAKLEEKTWRSIKHRAVFQSLFTVLIRVRDIQPVRLDQSWAYISGNALLMTGCHETELVGVAHDWRVCSLSNSPRNLIEAAFMGLILHSRDPIWTAFVGPTRPSDLSGEHRAHWVRRQAIAEAEAWLLDDTCPSAAGNALNASSSLIEVDQLTPDATNAEHTLALEIERRYAELSEDGVTPLDALIAAEQTQANVEPFADLLELVTPGQRDIVELLVFHLEQGLTLPDAKKAVAGQLGVQVGAIHTNLSRIRHQVPEPLR